MIYPRRMTDEELGMPTQEQKMEAWALLEPMAGMLHDSYERAGGVDKVIADLDADVIVG